MTPRLAGLLAITALAIGGCTSTPTEAPPAATPAPVKAGIGYTPVVSLNEIMVYVVDTHSNELWDATMVPPKNDGEWKTLQRAAVAISAAGSLTRLSGNGPDDQRWTEQADWATFSQDLANAGSAALLAVRAKDNAALAKAGDQLVISCIKCHREYKLNVPTIWTERQFPPEEQRP